MTLASKSRQVSMWMLVACGIWLLGLGLYFIALRPPLLQEDARFMGSSLSRIRNAVPGLEAWLKIVFTVMGGFMASSGVLTVFVASRTKSSRFKGAFWALALSGASSMALMSVANFALHSDFRWYLLAPALFWFAGLVLFVVGRFHHGSKSPHHLTY